MTIKRALSQTNSPRARCIGVGVGGGKRKQGGVETVEQLDSGHGNFSFSQGSDDAVAI